VIRGTHDGIAVAATEAVLKGFQWDMPEVSMFVPGACSCFLLGNGSI
jgi:hypothetical protein